jgi:hypothetical protein
MKVRSKKFSDGRTLNPAELAQFFPTPKARDYRSGNREDSANARRKKERGWSPDLNDVVLWPTPTAFDWNTAVKGRTERGSKTYKSNLKEAVQMFPTPLAGDADKYNLNRDICLPVMVHKYPTPTNSMMTVQDMEQARFSGSDPRRPRYQKAIPAPAANDAKNSLTESQRGIGTLTAHAVELTFPTPGTTGLSNGSGNCESINKLYEKDFATDEERRSMRAGNGGQLNPGWVEALMGYPQGWTDIDREVTKDADYPARWLDGTWEAGIPRVISGVKNRVSRLKCLGNAVVPQIPELLWRLIARALWE